MIRKQHIHRLPRKTSIPSKITSILATAALIATPAPLLADEEYEWQAGEGYHEEEWYDPSDWFNDDDMVSYEYDNTYYNDAYWADDSLAYDDWTYDTYDPLGNDGWYDTYDYDDYVYTDAYTWDPVEMTWVVDATGPNQATAGTQRTQQDRDTARRNQRNQQNRDTARRDRGQQAEAARRSEQSQSGDSVIISGTVAGFKKVDLRQEGRVPESHQLIKVMMKTRDPVVVNLGPKTGLDKLELERNDQVRIQGSKASINGRQVVMAKKITIDGDSHTIEKATRNLSVSGTLEQARRARIEGRDHLIARLQLQDKDDILVDLGPDAQLRDFNLEQGDSVRIRGTRSAIQGKSVLIANQISVEGEKTQIRERKTARQEASR